MDRDVIFLAESGEEADPVGVGINFMVNQHFDEIEAEFALNEGGGATIEDGRVAYVNVQTTKKCPVARAWSPLGRPDTDPFHALIIR